MKVTWVKGNLSSGRPVELATVVERIKDMTQTKPVKNMREMIPYCRADGRVADAEKIPVVVFASGYCWPAWRSF